MKLSLFKTIISCIFLYFFTTVLLTAQVKLGDNVNTINASSLMELESTSKGLLFTRMNTAQMNAMTTVKGMVIFNTDSNCLCNYNGGAWTSLCRVTTNEWSRSGNAIGSSASSFIGTTNNTDLVLKTNNAERLRIDSVTGNVGLNNRNPLTTLSVYGGLSIGKCDSVTITADNQTITVGNNSCIFMNSDNATAANRTIVLTNGVVMGQMLILVNIDRDANDAIQVPDNTNTKTAGAFNMGKDDAVVLIWNGLDWVQLSQSNN